jgi:membrane protease YdiL (CAAX protease family)
LLALTYVTLLAVMFPVTLLALVAPEGSWIHALIPHTLRLTPISVHLSWVTIVVFTVLNAFYEELVYMGYFFNQCAAKRNPEMAVVATVLLRLAVHTYQGTEHVLQIGVWSVVFGLWYRWGGKLWPLILAHIGIDVLSLGALKILCGAGP